MAAQQAAHTREVKRQQLQQQMLWHQMYSVDSSVSAEQRRDSKGIIQLLAKQISRLDTADHVARSTGPVSLGLQKCYAAQGSPTGCCVNDDITWDIQFGMNVFIMYMKDVFAPLLFHHGDNENEDAMKEMCLRIRHTVCSQDTSRHGIRSPHNIAPIDILHAVHNMCTIANSCHRKFASLVSTKCIAELHRLETESRSCKSLTYIVCRTLFDKFFISAKNTFPC